MSPRAAAVRARESPSTRDAILDAAERRFAERGFTGVSMREIAAEAGLKNQASLYHHFRDKRALYEAVLGRGVAPIVALVSETARDWPAGGTGPLDPEIVAYILDRILDYLDEHPHLPRLIQRAGMDDARPVRGTLPRLLRPLWAQGMRVLAGAAPWEPAELPHLAAGLYHLIFGYFGDAALLEAVTEESTRSPAALARQRRFLKAAVAQLLGIASPRTRPRALRRRT
jgi:AcrR family transcriptional regulator